MLPPAIVTEDLMMAISTENAPKRGGTAKTSSLSAKGTCESGSDAAFESLATLNSLANIPSNDIIIKYLVRRTREHMLLPKTRSAQRTLSGRCSSAVSHLVVCTDSLCAPKAILSRSQAAFPVFPWSEAFKQDRNTFQQ